MKFIDRESEIKSLQDEYNREGSSFVVLYGRRRTGKTTLLKEFIRNRPAVYFLGDLENENIQVKRFQEISAAALNDNFLKKINLEKLDALFEYIADKFGRGDKKLIIIIDEFQYLYKVNKAIPSIFQRIWDNNFKDNNIMLILCGSVISLMYETSLNYSSPLYGRRTSQIRLQPLKFKDYGKFFPGINDNEKLIEFYGLTGGVPKYIEFIEEKKDIYSNIKNNFLNKNSFLYMEPKFVLKDEIREEATYFSILEAVSSGEHKIGNISKKLMLESKNITSFIEKLIDLEILEREVPVTEENPLKSKKGLYFIKDNFFRFWFKYIFPYMSYLEIEQYEFVMEKIKKDFHLFVSFVFEKVSKDFLLEQKAPFEIKKIGRWWDKDKEIDIIALSKNNEAIFGECKYWKEKVGLNVLAGLKEKASYVESKIDFRRSFFAIFSKSGFTAELTEISKKDENILLYSLDKMF
jgi:hypothetical protein